MDELTTRADRIEHQALLSVWDAADEHTHAAGGLFRSVHGDCQAVGLRSIPSVGLFNRVIGASDATRADGSLDQAISDLHDAGCSCQIGYYDDFDEGRRLRAWLQERGFEEAYAWMKFIHSGDTPASAGKAQVIVRRCDATDGVTFGQVFVESFGVPGFFAPWIATLVVRSGWHCYLAETPDGEPAGAGAMFIEDGAAWLGMGGTRPDFRRLGAQGAILRARISDANAVGCDLIVTETGERVEGKPSTSYANILRVGFAEHRLRRHMIAAP